MFCFPQKFEVLVEDFDISYKVKGFKVSIIKCHCFQEYKYDLKVKKYSLTENIVCLLKR